MRLLAIAMTALLSVSLIAGCGGVGKKPIPNPGGTKPMDSEQQSQPGAVKGPADEAPPQ